MLLALIHISILSPFFQEFFLDFSKVPGDNIDRKRRYINKVELN